MQIKYGNKSVLVFSFTDKDFGLPVSDLASAIAIKFQMKDTQTGTAIISKDLTSGIDRNIPTTGDITVTILPADFTAAVTIGKKYTAIQIEYSATDIREIDLRYNDITFNQIEITQDIIQ